jgi:tetratricopeptide (TPR) repeat protein
VQLAPDEVELFLDRGDVHRSLGQWQLAAEDYRRAVALDHRSSQAYQRAAWILATCPVDRYRNADLAVQAAEKALELDDEQDVKYLDTVAAAYASAGQFEKACETLARAIAAAPAEAETFRRRLALYQRQEPYREPQPRGTAAP